MKPKIIYVTGPGRTGSTLLGNTLQKHGHGSFACELLWYLTHEDSRNDESVLCGCGQQAGHCDFWKKMNLDQFILNSGHFRNRNWITFFFPFLKRYTNDKEKIKLILNQLHDEFNAPIIDTSKSPIIGRMLKHIYGDQIYIIRTKRPIKDIVQSWKKPKGPLPARNSLVVFLEAIWYNFLIGFMKLNKEIDLELSIEETLKLEPLGLPQYDSFNEHPISGNPSR